MVLHYSVLYVLRYTPLGTSRKGACGFDPMRLLSSVLGGSPRWEREVVSFLRALSEGKVSAACCGTGNWEVMGKLEACCTTEIGQARVMYLILQGDRLQNLSF